MVMITEISEDVDDNESYVLSIQNNGRMKQMNRSWLVDGGRAAGSALAEEILGTGTDAGLQGSTEIHVPGVPDSDFDVAFDLLCAWLRGENDEDLYKTLTLKNCPAFSKMASYCRCRPLEKDIQREWNRLIHAQLDHLVGRDCEK
jgi:hypothetical protein